MDREAMWISLDSSKFEHVRLTETNHMIYADGIILHMNTDSSTRVRYKIQCNYLWQVQKAELNLLDESEGGLIIYSDRNGNWKDHSGHPIYDLDNCIDLDIYYSAFTNTLAIQRLKLNPGETKDINTAYINLPDLTVMPDPQRYTCLRKNESGAVYLYESGDNDFKAELTVDSDMLLINISIILTGSGHANKVLPG